MGNNEREALKEMSAPVTTPKPFIFVLIPFDAKFSDIYKFGIKGAADDVGAYAERLDEQIFVEGMLDRIFNQISRADVIVADMTARNPNVFYEVGYAHALGKVTLLLTQNADDIPFDLKHRQHTVYGGSIDVLRKELADRLRWAVAESRRQAAGAPTERLSIRLFDTDIPRAGTSREVPELAGHATARSFTIPLQIRNDSYDVISAITHVYVFVDEKAGVVPCVPRGLATPSGGKWLDFLQDEIKPVRPIEHFTARPVDAQDGLIHQFRLPVTVPSLPPGAVEATQINCIFKEGEDATNSIYRLRFHTTSQFHDYTFRLKIHYEAPPKKEFPQSFTEEKRKKITNETSPKT